MRIGDRVDDSHRPGQGELELARRVGAGERRLARVDGTLAAQRTDDGGAVRLVAVVADAHPHLVGEVDAVDLFEEAVDEMLARLLALGDDVDAGILLFLESEQGRVALGFEQLLAAALPRRPQHARLGEPRGLG